jgi:PQQ-dependent catabolism-associated CXXCW motif protein
MILRALVLVSLCLAGPAGAESFAEAQAKRPELFDPETGYRIGRQRAPTPEDIPPPARLVGSVEAAALIAAGALVLDVYGAAQSRFDELDGTWLVSEPRLSLPGALWLPETGRGQLDPVMQAYLADNLAAAMGGDLDRPIVVFCIADCWMSWNAAQRISAMGYSAVHWYRLGTDGWLDEGWTLERVDPVPVGVDD